MTDIVQMTQEKKDALEQELVELKTIKRPEIAERVQYARSLGDLKENSEYHSAREQQGKNETRIQEIEYMLKYAHIIEKSASSTVQLMSVVTIQKDGDETKREFTIVTPQEADMSTGKMSSESPIGVALFGKAKGDIAEVKTPSGITKWKIIKVS